jgi:two-component system NarL family sensor kinase
VLQSELEDVATLSTTIDLLLDQIHHDILYLEQRLQTDDDRTDPSRELSGFATANSLYKHIAWVSTAGDMRGGHLSDQLTTWLQTPTFDDFATLPANSIRIMPTSGSYQDLSLVAAATMDTGVLLVEINADYLLQGIRNREFGNEWSLWIPPGTMITTASTPPNYQNLSLDQFAGASGHFISAEWVYLYQRTGPGSEWTLIRHLPVEILRADLSNYYLTFSILLLGGLVSIVGLALFAIARIIEPVYQLTERVDSLRRGDTPPPFQTPPPADEFGKLMTGFDQMAAELEHQRQVERALVEQLITAQEEERKLIAYDLHDGLIQKLVGARFYLRSCRQGGERTGDADQINNGYEVLTTAIAEGRRIIQGLHPTVLDDLGLEAALEELANMYVEQTNWEVFLNITPLDEQPDRVTSVTLYRIAQEALNNVAKHANASRVWLTLRCFGDEMRLCIRDNGCGFDINAVQPRKREGWGIRTMRERAAMLHGDCDVESTPGTGSRVRVTIPYVCQ